MSPDGVENRRHELRVALNLSAELHAAGHVHPAVIQNLSRFGARVCGSELSVATPVELVIARDGRSPVVIAGTVVYRITDRDASRLRTLPGVGIRFDDAVTHDPSTFAALVDGLHTAPAQPPAPRARLPRFATRPTQPMAIPLLAHLVDTTHGPLDGDQPRFAGTLSELSVPTLLVLLEQGRKSGRLVLACAHLRATIDVVDGQIVGAESSLPGCSTDEVLMFVLDWVEGTFELVRTSAAERPLRAYPPIAITRLLLEHARIRDEAARLARRNAMAAARRSPALAR